MLIFCRFLRWSLAVPPMPYCTSSRWPTLSVLNSLSMTSRISQTESFLADIKPSGKYVYKIGGIRTPGNGRWGLVTIRTKFSENFEKGQEQIPTKLRNFPNCQSSPDKNFVSVCSQVRNPDIYQTCVIFVTIFICFYVRYFDFWIFGNHIVLVSVTAFLIQRSWHSC